MDSIFNIALSDSDSDSEQLALTKARRTQQTEESWTAIRDTYHVKIENGNVYKHVNLPLQKGTNKQQIQQVIHAAEELYFFRKYDEAIIFLDRVLARGQDQESEALDSDTRALLAMYRARCKARRDGGSSGGDGSSKP